MLNLYDYIINKDLPSGKNGWYAGDQLEALHFYLDNVIFLTEWKEADYQGNVFAFFKVKGTYVLWRDSFGSCSGCDSLEDNDGYEYIKATLAEGNTRQFKSVKQARKYLNETEDYLWKIPEEAKEKLFSFTQTILDKMRDNYEETQCTTVIKS